MDSWTWILRRFLRARSPQGAAPVSLAAETTPDSFKIKFPAFPRDFRGIARVDGESYPRPRPNELVEKANSYFRDRINPIAEF